MTLEMLMQPFPGSWSEQRVNFYRPYAQAAPTQVK
jgi:hypothetical protein